MPVRQRQEVQKLSRQARIIGGLERSLCALVETSRNKRRSDASFVFGRLVLFLAFVFRVFTFRGRPSFIESGTVSFVLSSRCASCAPGTRHFQRVANMAVNFPSIDPANLHPVAGVTLGWAEAGISENRIVKMSSLCEIAMKARRSAACSRSTVFALRR